MQIKNNVLGLDIGSARIGVAIITDGLNIPRTLPAVLNDSRVLERLREIAKEKDITQLVIGLPRNLNGDETAQTAEVRLLADKIGSELGLPVKLQDEALTSQHAEELLKRINKPYEKAEIDSLAASQILSDYVDQEVRI